MNAVPNQYADAASRSVAPKKNKTVSIGVVLEQLQAEFPDVTVSKIRFLESEGLVTPSRTASGYRRFTDQDIERLRFILTVQRDNYLPLKVIRQQLEAMDTGNLAVLASVAPVVDPAAFKTPVTTRLTDTDVAAQAGCEHDFLASLISNKIIVPDDAGFFSVDDVAVVQCAGQLQQFGYDIRHVRTVNQTVRRQAEIIGAGVRPLLHQKQADSTARAEEIAHQISATMTSLHAALLKNAVRGEIQE